MQFVSKGFGRPTPAGDLQRASLSCEKERIERGEMKQRAEGLTPPSDVVISSFSHHIEEEGEQCTTDKLTWSSHKRPALLAL